jgi:hypothetical protein
MLLADPIRHDISSIKDMCLGEDEWVNFPKLAKLESAYVFYSAGSLMISTLLIFKYLTPFPKVRFKNKMLWLLLLGIVFQLHTSLYIQFSKVGIFVHTMVAAGRDLVTFSALLAVLLFGFAIIGHLLFGHVLDSYSTVQTAYAQTVLSVTGSESFDYTELVEASDPVSAGVYFFRCVCVCGMHGVVYQPSTPREIV